MAREDYWNRGRQSQELRSNSTLDLIERLAKIGAGVAGKVKEHRDERGKTLQRRLSGIVGEGGSKYKRLIDNKDITPLKLQLDGMRKDVMRSDADTIGVFDLVYEDLEQKMKDNTSFNIDKDAIFKLEDNLVEDVVTLRESQANNPQDIPKLIEKIKQSEKTYLKARDRFINYFPERTKNDKGLVLGMTSVEDYTGFLFKELRDTGYLDETTYNVFTKGLIDGNLNEIEIYENNRKWELQTTSAGWRGDMDTLLGKANISQSEFDAVFPKRSDWTSEVNHYNKMVVGENFDIAKDNFSLIEGELTPINTLTDSYFTKTQDGWEAFKEQQAQKHQGEFVELRELDDRYKEKTTVSYLGDVGREAIGAKQDVTKNLMEAVAEKWGDLQEEEGGVANAKSFIKSDAKSLKALYNDYLKAFEGAKQKAKKEEIKKRWNNIYNKLNNVVMKKTENQMQAKDYYLNVSGLALDRIE